MIIKRSKPLVCVRNDSKTLSDERVARYVPAIQRQLDEHFEPAWGIGARIRFHEGALPQNAYAVTVVDEVEDGEDFVGYHVREGGYPEAFILAKAELEASADRTVSETLSHEVLEMLINPAVNLFAHRPGSAKRRPERGYFYEVCDAVQCVHYHIDRVKVCNFVYPEWFEHNWKRGSRRFDHEEKLTRPFQILEGCYMNIYEAGVGERVIWGKNPVARRQRHRHAAMSGFKLYEPPAAP